MALDTPAPAATTLAPARRSQFDQLRDLTARPAVRSALPFAGILVALLLAGLAWAALREPPYRPIFEALAEADKAAVTTALKAGGITHRVDPETGAVEVPETSVHEARILLAGQGLPKGAPAGETLLASIPMGASRALEAESLRRAREADLARTIEAIDAVKSARVMIAMPENSAFVRETRPAQASILLVLHPGRTLPETQAQAIRHLAASSVPGLDPANVSIVDQRGTLLAREANGADARALETQKALEERYREAIGNLLLPVLGAGNFSAEVSVTVDASESQATRETYPANASALRAEETARTVTTSPEQAARGIPGALSNQPPLATQVTAQPPADGAAPQPAQGVETSENVSRRFETGREISVTHQPMGRVSRISVAVAIRNQADGKPRPAAEVAALEQLIKGAVGFNAPRGDVVSVVSRRFADEPEATESLLDHPMVALAIRQAGAIIAALLVFFLVGRPFLRRLRAKPEPAAEGLPAAGPTLPAAVTLDMIEAAPSYAARAELVRNFAAQNPERAALVVRDMLREGANG